MSQACLLGDLRIEATTSDHVARMPEELSDRFVDGWRENGHSRVVLAGDDIVATGLSCPNRVHPTRDLLFITVREAWRRQGIGTLLHRELSALHQVPFSAKAAPGSATHAFVTSLGAWVYQHCPGGRVDAALPEVREWARRHRGDGADGGGPVVRRGEELGPGRLRELITDLYEVVRRTRPRPLVAAGSPTRSSSTSTTATRMPTRC